jgi:hypothetical protein
MKLKLAKPSTPFLIALVFLLAGSLIGKPILRWVTAQYDAYKASTITLTASASEYQKLLETIRVAQPGQTLKQPVPAEFLISEKIFQAAIAPDMLGRSSQYEPYTSNGKLACAWMVNKVLEKALNAHLGQNRLYVPSIVEDLDRGAGKRIAQTQTRRGDIAISNGTNYEKGLWHIGICANPTCTLVLSNSPFTSRFAWLSDANFDGAFAHYPGETTFYRVTRLTDGF